MSSSQEPRMFKPEDIPPGLPEDVKALLTALKPEPSELIEKRKRLVAELTSQAASATGPVQPLLVALREVFLAMQPEVPFKASLAEDFSRAFQRYSQDPAALASMPPLLTECITYLHERVESTGLGAILEKARASAPRAQPAGKRTKG